MSDIFDLPDLDMDDDFGLGDFEGDSKVSKTREVITSAASGAKESIKSEVLSKSTIKRLVQLSLGDGYSQAISAYDNLEKQVSAVYGDNKTEITGLLKPLAKSANEKGGRLAKLIPKWLKDTLDETNEEYQQKYNELDENIAGIGDLLKLQAKSQRDNVLQSARKDAKDSRNLALNMQGFQAISTGIGRLVSYQDKVTHSYQAKSLELGYRQLDVLRKMHEMNRSYYEVTTELFKGIQKNTGLPEVLKTTSTEFLQASIKQKLADKASNTIAGLGGKYLKNIGANAGNYLKAASAGAGMADSLGGMAGSSKAGMAGNVAGGLVGEGIGNVLNMLLENVAGAANGKLSRIPGLSRGDTTLKELLTNSSMKVMDWTRSDTKEEGLKGQAIELLKSLLHQDIGDNVVRGGDITDLENPYQWNLQSHRTLNEIIPAYLSSMDRSLAKLSTGEDRGALVWSDYDRELITKDASIAQHVKITLKNNQGDSLRYQVDGLLREIGVKSLSLEAQKALRNKLISKMMDASDFKPGDYVKREIWVGQPEYIVEELVEFFAERFGLAGDGALIDDSLDNRNNIQELSRRYGEVARSVPNYGGRIDALSGITGRNVYREMGLTKKDGFGSDVVDRDKLIELITEASQGYTFDQFDEEVRTKEAEEQAKRDSLKSALKGAVPDSVKGFGDNIKNKTKGLRTRLSTAIATLSKMTPEELGNVVVEHKDKGVEGIKAKYQWAKNLSREDIEEIVSEAKKASVEKYATVSEAVKEYDKEKNISATIATNVDKVVSKKNREALGDYVSRIREFLKKYTFAELMLLAKGSPQEFSGKLAMASESVRKEATELNEFLTNSVAGRKIAATLAKTEDLRESVTNTVKTMGSKAGSAASESVANLGPQVQSNVDTSSVQQDQQEGIFGDVRTHELLEQLNETQIAQQTILTEVLESIIGLSMQQEGKPMEGISDVHQRNRSTRFQKMGQYMRNKFGSLGKRMKGAGSMLTSAASMAWRPVGLFGRYMRGSFALMGKTAGVAKDLAVGTLKLGFKGRKGLGGADIFLKDDPENILLKASDIRKGSFIDMNTGKPVKKLKDITGPVSDKDGNIVISQDEFEQGLASGNGESLVGFATKRTAGAALGLAKGYGKGVMGFYGLIGKAIGGAGKMLADDLKRFDAYFPGEAKPRIRSHLLKQGYYRTEDGTVITSLDEISGAVLDPEGNIIISVEDLQENPDFVKKNGGKLYKIGSGAIGSGKWAAKKAFALGKWYVGAVAGLYKGAFRIAKAVLKSPLTLYRKLRGANKSEGTYREATLDIAYQQLLVQHKIFDNMSKQNAEDDSPRENSWDDIKNKRKKRREATLRDVVDAIQGMREDNNQLLTGILDKPVGGSEGGGIMDKVKGVGSAIAGAAGWLAGKVGLKKGGFLRKGLARAGSFIGRQVGWQAIRTVGGLALGAIGVTGAIVVGAVAAVAVVGYFAYKGWTKAQAKKMTFNWLRMVQYGIKPIDKDEVEAIAKMEAYVLQKGTYTEGTAEERTVQLSMDKLDLKTTLEIFGISHDDFIKNADNPKNKTVKRVQALIEWLDTRFSHTYKSHATAMLAIDGQYNLQDTDGLLKGPKSKQYLDRIEKDVSALEDPDFYNKLTPSPFSNKLWADDDEVKAAIERARTKVEQASKAATEDKSLHPGLNDRRMENVREMKENTVLNVTTDGTGDVSKITSNISTRGGSKRGLAANNGFVLGDKKSLTKKLPALDSFTAVRYSAYGLTEMTLSKVEQLWLLETYILQYTGSNLDVVYPEDGFERVKQIFRVKSDADEARAQNWYMNRFMVILATYVRSLRDRTVSDLIDGYKSLNVVHRRSIMSELLNINHEGKENPWTITDSPWAGYSCPTSTSITEPYFTELDAKISGSILLVDGKKVTGEDTTKKDGNTNAATLPAIGGGGLTLSSLNKTRTSIHDYPSTSNRGDQSKVSNPSFGTGEIITSGAKHTLPKGPGRAAGEKAMLAAAKKMGITDPTEIAMLLAQTAEESGAFSAVEENLNYRAETMIRVWPGRFKNNPELARKLAAAGPEAIANSIYGNRMGNTEPGDGWKYRGRGYMQLTGKDNYRAMSKQLGVDLVSNPDLLTTQPGLAAESAVAYWLNRGGGLRDKAKRGDTSGVTQLINGGQTGLSKRDSFFKQYLQLVKDGSLEAATAVEEDIVKEESGETTSNVVPIAAATTETRQTGRLNETITTEAPAETTAPVVETAAVASVAATTAAKPTAEVVTQQNVQAEKGVVSANASNETLSAQLLTMKSMEGILGQILTVLSKDKDVKVTPVASEPPRRNPTGGTRTNKAI